MYDHTLIFDIGMHTGEDTDFYLKKGFRVVGVEANPHLAAYCRHRFDEACQSGRLVIIDKAIANTSGTIDFYVSDQKSEWGTANRDWMLRNEKVGKRSRAIQVSTICTVDLLRDYGTPYYLKVDIEGFDHLCISDLVNWRDKPKYTSVECHAYSCDDTLALLHALIEAGYRKFNIVSQLGIRTLTCPNPAREGPYVEHSFPEGASGLFGQELPGPWFSASDTELCLKKIYRNIRMNGPHNGVCRYIRGRYTAPILNRLFPNASDWYDLHATA